MKTLALIGIGGYGAVHLEATQQLEADGRMRLSAAADPRLSDLAETHAALTARGVACYTDHREMLAQHTDLDGVLLAVPIMLHAPLTLTCLERGLPVLVEKPPAGTVAEVATMRAAAENTGKPCGIAFQYSTSPMLRALCAVIAAGRLGRIRDVSALCLSQRADSYYTRAPWAGHVAFNGSIVRDGSLNNPFAHIAQLLLTFAGAAEGRVARPQVVRAELLAGHDIESEDTSAVCAELDTGATLHFYASLCTHEGWLQEIRVTGTLGTATWSNQRDPQTIVTYHDGTTEILPPIIDGDDGTTTAVIRNFLDVLEGRTSRLACPIEDTQGFASLVEQAFTGTEVAHLHGSPYVERVTDPKSGEILTYLQGIETIAREAYNRGCSLAEAGASWACTVESAPPAC